VRLGAGRPRLELEILEPADLGPVRYLLGLANDDHAPSSPLDRIPAIDLKHGRLRVHNAGELGTQRRAEHHGLRSLIEDVIDRTDNGWQAGLVDGDAPDPTAHGGHQPNALATVQLKELDQRTTPVIRSCRRRSASKQAMSRDRPTTTLDTIAQPASTDHRVHSPHPAFCNRPAINRRDVARRDLEATGAAGGNDYITSSRPGGPAQRCAISRAMFRDLDATTPTLGSHPQDEE
jgi:hypothetical protein